MKRNYHTIDKQGKAGERKLTEFLVRNGQALLPMMELIEHSRMAIDELIDVMGRASVEAVLELSAMQVAGPPQQGKARPSEVGWHGTQPGRVYLKERKLKVNRPRLRNKGRGANKEVSVPAYQAMQQNSATGERMLEILMNGVSTRGYSKVIPEMADTVGVSRSTVSRETIEASEAALKKLLERRFDEVELLIIYIDGMHFGDQCVLAAVGVDLQGCKHVLALREGATENAEAAKDLLQHLVERGVDPKRRRLFIIDGSKALRAAINAVFGAEAPVQRCRNHKLRNVLSRLPREQQAQTGSLMRAAWKLNQKDGMAKFRQIAGWLEHDYPQAAAALLEGLEECFTINRLDIPRSLHRCLATSNIVDNPHSGVRSRTRRVCRWRPGMPARWSEPHSWKEKSPSGRSWVFAICGPSKRSWMDRSQPPGRRWRRITMHRRSQLPTAIRTPSNHLPTDFRTFPGTCTLDSTVPAQILQIV